MTPSLADVIRFIVVFELGFDVTMINVFTGILSALSTSDWDDVLNDGKAYFNDMYNDWMGSTAGGTQSTEIRLQRRDQVLGQWDEVAQDVYTDLTGIGMGTATASPNTGSCVAYTALPRFRGRKGLPPPDEAAMDFGVLTPAAVVDLTSFATKYVQPMVESNASMLPGILSEGTEIFREFTGGLAFSDVNGTQVTRKIGRGQ